VIHTLTATDFRHYFTHPTNNTRLILEPDNWKA